MKPYSIVTLDGAAVAETPAQPLVENNGKSLMEPESDATVVVRPTMQPISERFPALEEQKIVLKYFAPLAREVKVAGNFNGWNPEATPLKNAGAGEWGVRLRLRSGQYEYRFVVDGGWREDPQVSQRVDNPYGAFNSVLTVPLSVRTSML